MTKAVMSAVAGGAMVFAGTAATDASHKNAIPANLRAQFEKFWAEVHKNTPKEMANRQPAPVDNVVSTSSRTEAAPKRALIRLAAAGSDMDFQTPEMTAAAVRPLIPVKPDCVLPISTSTEPPAVRAKHFEIGDKLKLAFFENVEDVERNKWGNAAGTGFQQHPELSGDYSVQEDGTISVPVLGMFKVLDLTLQELQAQMAVAFNKALGRKGFVTIMSIDRPPIYVLGPVKNPGSYTYSPGMTVLHAITLAGGFPREDGNEPWQKLEKIREQTKRYGTLESISELLTRQAVLKSERDRGNPTPPPQLVELVGPAKAAAMMSAEVDRRSGIVTARMAQLQSAVQAVKMAQQEVDLLAAKSRTVDAMDANVEALKKHADALSDLNRKGIIANYQVIDARTHVADAERNRQDVVSQLAQAKERLAAAQQAQATLEANTRSEVDTQLLTLSQQIADAGRENRASEGILGALRVQYLTSPASAIGYQIVRQTSKGPVAYTATGMSTLIPGDLVQVSTTEDNADPNLPAAPGQPNTRQATVTGCR